MPSMTNLAFLLLLVLLICPSLQDKTDTDQDDEITIESSVRSEYEPNPFADVAAEILKEQLAQNIGPALQGMFAGGNGGNGGGGGEMLDILSSMAGALGGNENQGGNGGDSGGAAALIQGFSALMANRNGGNDQGGIDAGAILQGLGALMGNNKGGGRGNQNEGGIDPGALLQGMAALMGNRGGQGGQGGLNLEMISSVLQAFAPQDESETKKKRHISEDTKGNEIDVDNLNLSDMGKIAGKLLGKGSSTLMSYLPMIMQALQSFSGPEADAREKQHESHSSMMPPFLEKMHVYFDHFLHTDMGKNIIAMLGAEKAFKAFADENGRFDYKKFGELMENHSFRKHWISTVTDRVADLAHTYLDPRTFDTVLMSAQYLVNTYLKTQGFPKQVLLDPQNPVESVSKLINFVFKKYFDIKIKSKEYVAPVIEFLMGLKGAVQNNKLLGNNSKEFSGKLADTINMEIIEPLVRVNRAYRFAKTTPQCDRYVMCLVNEKNQNEKEDTLPSLKKLLYRGSSLVAAWFLTSVSDTPYWTLYTDITTTSEESNCKTLYSERCDGFHTEEMKVTTEYIHNEL
nr:unnamed protein product [Callosobruchus analis]